MLIAWLQLMQVRDEQGAEAYLKFFTILCDATPAMCHQISSDTPTVFVLYFSWLIFLSFLPATQYNLCLISTLMQYLTIRKKKESYAC